jgi:hypothetical protein
MMGYKAFCPDCSYRISGFPLGSLCPICNTFLIVEVNMSPDSKVTKEAPNLSSAERKARPVFSGVMMYFPDAIMEVSAHSKRGSEKHHPGKPLHWDKDKSKDHADCIARHLIDIGPNWDAIDHETQGLHAAALAWRALALLQTVLERKNKV